MGFEENYLDAIQNPRWRNTIKSIESGSDSDCLIRQIESSLCGDCRDGKMVNVRSLVLAIGGAYIELSDKFRTSLYLTESDVDEAINRCYRSSILTTSSIHDDDIANLAWDAAAKLFSDNLYERYFWLKKIDDIHLEITIKILYFYTYVNMQKSLYIVARNCRISFKDLQILVKECIDDSYPVLKRVGEYIMKQNELKIKSTRKTAIKIQDVTKLSLYK